MKTKLFATKNSRKNFVRDTPADSSTIILYSYKNKKIFLPRSYLITFAPY